MDATKQRMRVAGEAAKLWVTMQGNPSRAERMAYVVWLQESPAHVAETVRLCQVHAKLKRFGAWASITIEDPGGPDEPIVDPRRRRPTDGTGVRR